jgi:hypothetical protein
MKYGGNDTVYAASLKLDVYDTWGNLSVHGAAGFMNINKSAWDEKQYYPNDLYAPLCYKHLRQ